MDARQFSTIFLYISVSFGLRSSTLVLCCDTLLWSFAVVLYCDLGYGPVPLNSAAVSCYTSLQSASAVIHCCGLGYDEALLWSTYMVLFYNPMLFVAQMRVHSPLLWSSAIAVLWSAAMVI